MNETILIIDDLASVRLYHSIFLERKGYRCLLSANGTEAMERLREHAVDLVLLDLVMPGMNGRDFLCSLAREPGMEELPVLVITSEQEEGLHLSAEAHRRLAVLTKPVMPAILLQKVQELLPRSSTSRTEIPAS